MNPARDEVVGTGHCWKKIYNKRTNNGLQALFEAALLLGG